MDQAQSEDIRTVLFLCGMLIVAVSLAYMTIKRLKKRWRQDDPTQASGFTLADLRQLHKDGSITDEEFEKAKVKIVEATQRAVERDAASRKAAGKKQ